MFSDGEVRVVQAEDRHDEDEGEEIRIVKFSEVISTFNAIASHVQNDQPELVKLLAFAQGVLKSYRKGLTVDLDFTTEEGQENQIPTATSRVSTTASKRVRLRSTLENQRRNVIKQRSKVGAVTTLYRDQTSEEANLMLERKSRGTKTCTLCGLGRHTAFKCDLVGDFGTSLTKGCLQSRMALISDLVGNERFAVCRIADDDDRLALKSLPKSVSAMILHTKCRLGREVVIETTLIRHKCVAQEFSKLLFKIEAINGWLTGSKQKPVGKLIPIERFFGKHFEGLRSRDISNVFGKDGCEVRRAPAAKSRELYFFFKYFERLRSRDRSTFFGKYGCEIAIAPLQSRESDTFLESILRGCEVEIAVLFLESMAAKSRQHRLRRERSFFWKAFRGAAKSRYQ
jgi:hypothetical protein